MRISLRLPRSNISVRTEECHIGRWAKHAEYCEIQASWDTKHGVFAGNIIFVA